MDSKALRESFELIEIMKEAFAHDFYTGLFRRYPALHDLFVQDMYIQERSLVLTLQMIVQTAEQEEDLFPVLYKLGLRHQTYGVKAEHYPALIHVGKHMHAYASRIVHCSCFIPRGRCAETRWSYPRSTGKFTSSSEPLPLTT